MNRVFNKIRFIVLFNLNRILKRLIYRRTSIVAENVSHLFFHSLSIKPSKSFAAGNDSVHDFESWFVSVDEFRRILAELYKRNYVLVDYHKAYSGSLALPDGKKALVLSFDDLNYYDYMRDYGFSNKMVLTDDGEIANTFIDDNGNEQITFDGDHVAVLEQFIKIHPDFSFEGARGILALTGYEGILGFTHPKKEKAELQPLVAQLKKRGWVFASHSWRHHHLIYSNGPVSFRKTRRDIRKWFRDVSPYIGKVDAFVAPFGIDIRSNPLVDIYLRHLGFRFFYSVDYKQRSQFSNQAYYCARLNVDGIIFSNHPCQLFPYIGNPFFLLSSERSRQYPNLNLSMSGLVEYARKCLNRKTIYIWNGMGEEITEDRVNKVAKMYPGHYSEQELNKFYDISGKGILGFDCSGLITRYFMGGLDYFDYCSKMDLNSAGLVRESVMKGPVCDIPEKPGLCLYMKGHTGIYIGRGEVIESTSNPKFGNGVVKTMLSDREWEQWYQIPWLLN